VGNSTYFSIRHPNGFFEGIFNSLPILVTGPLTAMGLQVASFYLSRLGGYRKLVAQVPALQHPEAHVVLNAMLADASRNGGLGAAIDCQQGLSPLYAQATGEAVQAYRHIQIPVELWYGTKDSTVPLRTAEWLRDILPRARLHTRPTGHGLYFFHTAEVLDSLCCLSEVDDTAALTTTTKP
jgi:pimeloyl-ACP methyl ester carboxylesterase